MAWVVLNIGPHKGTNTYPFQNYPSKNRSDENNYTILILLGGPH